MSERRVICIPSMRCRRCRSDFIGLQAGLCLRCDGMKAAREAEISVRRAQWAAEKDGAQAQ